MKLTIKREHFFCLRNWALYSGLQIRLTVSYAGETPDAEQTLDLHGSGEAPPGILMLLQPEAEGTGLLCIAPDPAWGEPAVTAFRLHLETEGKPIAGLHLEYAAADAMTAYQYTRIPWENTPLTQPDILFTRQDEGFAAGYLTGDPAVPAGPQEQTETGDIAEDIRADLTMLGYYSGCEAARLASAFEVLLTGLPGMDAAAAADTLSEQEQQLVQFIDRQQAEIRRYQELL